MHTSAKEPLRHAAVLTAAGLALLLPQAGTATAGDLVGHAHRTVTTEGTTFRLNLSAGPTTLPASGGRAHVTGTGYNIAQGIFLAFCAIPATVVPGTPETYTTLPTPCLPGHATKDGSARRITNETTGTPGVTLPYGPNGSFTTTLDNLRPQIADGAICDVTVQCAIVTRADFTATNDRSYDQYIPVHFER